MILREQKHDVIISFLLVMYKNSGKDLSDADSLDSSGIQLYVQSRNSKKKLEFRIDPVGEYLNVCSDLFSL